MDAKQQQQQPLHACAEALPSPTYCNVGTPCMPATAFSKMCPIRMRVHADGHEVRQLQLYDPRKKSSKSSYFAIEGEEILKQN